jgi:hypothetical protein
MKPVTKLMRCGYILGYRRAKAKARAEMDSLADDIAALQDDFHEIERELHHARDLDEAIVERAMAPDESLH